jgi:L-threonylcarbamoyladenylate synthase
VIAPAESETIARAAGILRAGGLVAFPTETVYGLGADALNPVAAAGIFAAKGRPTFDPLIVHVPDADAARPLWAEVPAAAETLMRACWPGPLTLVLPKREAVPDIVTSALPTVAVRVPDHPVAAALLRAAGTPVAAPSANRFSRPSPTDAAAVEAELGDRGVFVLDGGPCRVGVESTVVAFPDGRPTVLRPGGVPVERLRSLIGEVAVAPRATAGAAASAGLASPGLLERHYAPTTPLRLVDDPLAELRSLPPGTRAGLLCLRRGEDWDGFAMAEELSAKGDLTEAAARLFAAIRRLDSAGLDVILAVPVPEVGLGLAIMDRLRRASKPAVTGH